MYRVLIIIGKDSDVHSHVVEFAAQRYADVAISNVESADLASHFYIEAIPLYERKQEG